ncbi:MAG: ABC transporter permease subunit [Burkholderiaceae bacterium]
MSDASTTQRTPRPAPGDPHAPSARNPSGASLARTPDPASPRVTALPPRSGRRAVIGLPYLWLLVFFLVPFLVVLKISVSEMDTARVGDVLSFKDGVLALTLRLSNYATIVQDDLYALTYLSSLKYAAITTLLCLGVGYPFAYFMARAKAGRQPALLMLVMLPFWTSFLLRVYAWKGLLTEHGWLSNLIEAVGLDRLLAAAGMIAAPGQLMNTPFSLVLGMTYSYLPFMILPLYANLSKMDLRLLEAASDLGASAWVAFWRITVPLSKAGIIAGSMLVFIPCVGEYVIPELLGGPQTQMIGRTLWDEFFSNNDWPMASTVAVAMVLLIIVPLAIFGKYQAQAGERRS